LLLHPFSWLLIFFVIEGLVRWLAAAFTEQTPGTLPLAFADWCYGKATARPAQGDAVHYFSVTESSCGSFWMERDRVRTALRHLASD
jgi:hypothetical protein